MDKWTGESACVYRQQSSRVVFEDEAILTADENEAAVAKLWSPYVRAGRVQCLRFRYRFEGKGRMSVLKHNRG